MIVQESPDRGEASPQVAQSNASLLAEAEEWSEADTESPGKACRVTSTRTDAQLVLRYSFLAVWLAVVFAGYALQRAWCACGIPYDCLQQVDYLVIFLDLTKLALFGGALAWYCRVTEPERFFWLFSWRRWYVWAVYVGLPPAYSGISNASFARESLHTLDDWGPGMIVAVSIVAALAFAAACGHLWLAKRGRTWLHFAVYLAARLVIYLYVIASALVLTGTGVATLHLHHLYLGWAAALLAEFNHWLSGLLLAAGTAVFVQGVGAYSFAPMFDSTRCFLTANVDHVACAFWDPDPVEKEPFMLQVCAMAGRDLPSMDCALWP